MRYNGVMVYRNKGGGRKFGPPKESVSLKIKLRGKDDAPLTMAEFRECLLEAARKLQHYEPGYRVKFSTVYLTMIDENGDPVRINDANELTFFPYKTAADEHGA